MRSITGVIRNDAGMVVHRGEPIGALSSAEIMKRGIAMVPEGRRLFPSLTVEENLLIGGQARKARRARGTSTRFTTSSRSCASDARAPARRSRAASSRWWRSAAALMSNPELLLCDEISLGLAPVVIRDIYAALPKIRAGGAAIVVVEQDIGKALVCRRPRLLHDGRPRDAGGKRRGCHAQEIHAAYFGEAA